MNQQFFVIRQYTVLRETEKHWQIFNRPAVKHVIFLQKCKEQKCFSVGRKILTQGMFVTQLCSNAAVAVWRV
jgi:hypothetical protein